MTEPPSKRGTEESGSRRLKSVSQFRLADTVQQIVGGFLLAGPFVVTEEVWTLATNMSIIQGVIVVGLVFVIGYGALYEADTDRDPNYESDVGGIPARFLSLMIVSFGAVTILALIFNAPATFLENIPSNQRLPTTLKAIAVGSVFSVVGAAAADSAL